MKTEKMTRLLGVERYAIHRSAKPGDRALSILGAMLTHGAVVLVDGDRVRLAGPVEYPLDSLLAGLRILARKGAALRRRYEAHCSHQWADTDAYKARTERAEAEVEAIAGYLGLTVSLCGDPRGPALHVAVDANLSHFQGLA